MQVGYEKVCDCDGWCVMKIVPTNQVPMSITSSQEESNLAKSAKINIGTGIKNSGIVVSEISIPDEEKKK